MGLLRHLCWTALAAATACAPVPRDVAPPHPLPPPSSPSIFAAAPPPPPPSSPADAPADPAQRAAAARADAMFRAAASGDFAAVRAALAPPLQDAVSVRRIAWAWRAFRSFRGELRAVDGKFAAQPGGPLCYGATVHFERGDGLASVVYDPQGRVAGLTLDYVPLGGRWKVPAYAKPDAFDDREVALGPEPALHGAVFVPHGATRAPAVVLAHGSLRMNESIIDVPELREDPIHIFADLAAGLATRGIVVLQYVNKKVPDVPLGTHQQDLLDPARAAIALLARTPEVDVRRIFVLAYEDDATLLPRLARQEPAVAGIILLGAPSRPLEDVIVDQCAHRAAVFPRWADSPRELADAKRFRDAVLDPGLDPDDTLEPPATYVRSYRGAYFLEVRGYDARAAARALPRPILVLHAAHDHFVFPSDFLGWKNALSGKPGAVLRTYPALGHPFVPHLGIQEIDSWGGASNVDPAVVGDVASWVIAQPPRT